MFGSDDDGIFGAPPAPAIPAPGQLPAEVPLPDRFKFHQIFVCPVSKEQAGPSNPPMRLKCGHVMCKNAVLSMRGARNGGRFKCPTCPSEQTVAECIEIVLA